MVKIIFNEPETDQWKKWKNKCKTETEKIIKNFENDNTLEFNKNIYNDKKIRRTIYFANKSDPPFYGKCVYCEKNITTFNHLDHFRPKAEVRDYNNNEVFIELNNTKKIKHPGYYWLAYDWKNLLPSCIDCNILKKEGKYIGKGTRFPINGEYALKPEHDLNREEPLLINPVVVNPDDYIEICKDTGFISSKNKSEKGETTINIFGLNENRLPEQRKKTIGFCKLKILEYIEENKIKELNNFINNIIDGKCEYSMAAKEVIKDLILC